MAKRRYYLQEKANTCAVAALRTILAVQFDVRVPEVALEALGTAADEPIRKHGTGSSELRRMIRGANRAFNTGKPWTLRIRTQGTIDDLRELTKKRPVLCRVYVPDNGAVPYHMVVVLGVTKTRVRVFDPGIPVGHTSPTHNSFLAEWLDREGVSWFATIGRGGRKCVKE